MSPEKTGTKQKGDRSAEPQFISMETVILLKTNIKNDDIKIDYYEEIQPNQRKLKE